MKLICTSFCDDVRDRSAAATKLGRVCIRQNNDLLHRVEVIRLEGLSLNGIVVIVLPVKEEVIAARTRSVHRKSGAVAQVIASDINDTRLSKSERDHV